MRSNTSARSPRQQKSRGTKQRKMRNVLLIAAAAVLLAATVAASATSASSIGSAWGGAASGVEAAVKSLASAAGVLPARASSSPALLPAQGQTTEGAGAGGPSVASDKPVYQAGDTAHFVGIGFAPGEVITLQVRHADGTGEGGAGHEVWMVTADADGQFSATWNVSHDDSTGDSLLLTADGPSGHAEYSFADVRSLAESMKTSTAALSHDEVSSPLKIAIYAAAPNTYAFDVRNKLLGTGSFAAVDLFNVSGFAQSGFPASPTPTLAQLQQYNAVLVFSDNGFSNGVALGNVFADYMDAGGGVVAATFAFYNCSNCLGIEGRILSANYLPFTRGTQSQGVPLTLVADQPLHPILAGVASFNGGTSSYHNNPISTTAGSTLVAHWSNGQPLVATKHPTSGRIVGLNFYPPSTGARSDFWSANTDGARLMANALNWAADNANSAPVANDNSYAIDEDAALNVPAPGVLANDTDANGNALTASLVSGPAHAANFSLNADGSFSYTPVADYFGPDSFTYRANDGSLNSNVATVNITVNSVNDAPSISGVPLSQTIDELTLYTLDADATDVDGPGPITFNVSGAPAGASINPSTGVFNWTPTEAQGPGVYTIIFKATDGVGASSTTSLQLNVNEVNAAPVTSCTGLTRPADGTGKAAVSAAEVGAGSSDPENDQLTLSLSPAGPYSVGTTIVTLTATDSGGASSTCSAAITVIDVTPPVISGVPANIMVEAAGPSGAAASWTAPTAADNVDGTITVNCSPASGSTFPLGTTTVNCSAADAAGNNSPATFNVTVKDTTAPAVANLPGTAQGFNWLSVATSSPRPSARSGHRMVYDPVRARVILFGGSNATGYLNDVWEFETATRQWTNVTPPSGPAPIPRSNFAMAYDEARNKVVVYGGNCSTQYSNVSIIGDTWEWDPAARTWAHRPASSLVFVGLSGSGATYDPVRQQVILFGGRPYWQFDYNGMFAWDGNNWVALSPATTPVGRALHGLTTDRARNRVVMFGGYNGNVLNDTWEWDGSNWTQFATSGPNPGHLGAPAMAYHAARNKIVLFGGSATADDTWEWDGASWNTLSPQTSPSPRASAMVYDASQAKLVMFGGGPQDDTWLSDEPSSITLEATGPAGAVATWADPTATDAVDGTVPVSCAPASGSTFPIGTTVVTCSATDAHGNTGQATFTVKVQDTTTPALALADVTAAATTPAGAAVSYTASASDIVDGNVTINCTPASGSTFPVGQTTVQCGAADSRGNTATGSFKVTVTNPAPVAQDLSFTTNEDTPVAAGLLAADPNGNALNYSVVAQPAHGSLTGTAPVLTYTPAANYHGPDSFTYKANDGTTDSNVATVSITVKAVNDAPVLAPVGDRSVDEETQLSFTAVGSDDRDNPAPNALTYSLVGAPAGASINPSTGAFSWTPTEQQGAGSYTFTVKVTDDGTPGLSGEETINVTVNEVNVAPVAADVPASLAGQWGDPVAFTATATDHDVTQPGDKPNVLSFSLVGAPDGASIDSSTGAFAWTPDSTQIGAHSFQVRVTDDGTPALHHELPVSVTVGKRATSLGYDGDTARKYWETATVSATLRDAGSGQTLAGKAVALSVGTQAAPLATTGADGKAQTSVHLTQDAGAYDAAAAFAGDDLYLPSDDSEPFAIEKADQTITWVEPAGIVYGTPLSATQLNATVSVPGSTPAGAVGYSPAAGTLLGAGDNQPLTVNVAGTGNYNPASKTVHIDVAKATPAINWDTPAAITFGVALSAAQLNATAAHPADSGPLAGQALPGTFTYNPAAGVVLPVGNNTLSVVFTPADSANYTTATKSVTQRVNYAVCALYDQTKAHKSGSIVPVKLKLCDASGNNLSSSGIVVRAVGTRLLSPNAWGPAEDAGQANPDMNFRFTMFDPATPGYIYNLKTTGMATGTYELGFTAGGDPAVYTVQFQVR